MRRTIFSITIFALSILIFPQSAHATEYLVNGNFSSTGGGWTGANYSGSGNVACTNGLPNIGTWVANQLSFSYYTKTVTQAVTIPTPKALTFQVTIASGGGTYTVSLSSTSGTTSLSSSSGGVNGLNTLNLTTTTNNEVVTISITGKDSPSWNGCYGPAFTNASLASPTLISTTQISDAKAGSATYRQIDTLTATIGNGGSGYVIFYAGNKKIAGCTRQSISAGLSTCLWRPSIKGSIQVTAQYISNDAGYLGSISTAKSIGIAARSNKR